MKKSYLFSFSLFLSSFLLAQTDVKIKDASSNTLLQINDEGSSGSITLPSLSSIETPTNKLYAIGTTLYWHGSQIGTASSAGGWTDGGTNIYNTTLTDRVGIGLMLPNELLEVAGNGRAFFGDGAGILRKGLLIDGLDGPTGVEAARLEAYNYSTSAGMNLVINTVGNGNVGIGTSDPLSKLSVGGSGFSYVSIWGESALTNGVAVRGFTSSTTGNTFGGAFQTNSISGIAVSGKAINSNIGSNYGGDFYAGGSTGIGVKGAADGNGGHGIHGESSGVNGIAVYGDANANSANQYGGYFQANSTGVGVYGYSVSGYGVYGKTNSTGGSAGVYGHTDFSGNGVEGVSKGAFGAGVYGFANGNNGIGVEGFGAVASTTYDFNASGPGIDYGSISSRRWKKNIIEIDNPIEKLMMLRGVYFDWDENYGGGHDLGMIAEEVGEVLPEIVIYEENGTDADGMDYSKLGPLIIEAVKQQQKIIDNQLDRIKELEARLNKLENIIKSDNLVRVNH